MFIIILIRNHNFFKSSFFFFFNNFMNANLILIVVVAAFSSLISAASVWDLHLFDTVGLRDEMHCNARKHKQIEKQKMLHKDTSEVI